MTALLRHKTFLDIFPAPEFLLLSSTGINITDSTTQFVELKREIFGRGFKLAHSGKLENPRGAVESGLIKNPAGLVSVLKKISSDYGIHYAHATLPEERVYLFTTTINRVPVEGLRDAVAFIIEENAPVSLSDSVFDFEIIGEEGGTGKIKLTVSVLPKSVVGAYVEAFESAGITPVSFDIESQAVAKAVIHRGDKRSHLIINLSANKTGLYVVDDEVVQFSITPTYGFGDDDSYLGLSDLKAEMRKVLAFWNARTNKSGQLEKKIEKIILCGPGASKKDFVRKLMEEIEVKYVLADVWLNTSASRDYAPNMPFDESLEYASAVGLVLPHKI
jgi:Tfp pilus assembly PilM family ATPase